MNEDFLRTYNDKFERICCALERIANTLEKRPFYPSDEIMEFINHDRE